MRLTHCSTLALLVLLGCSPVDPITPPPPPGTPPPPPVPVTLLVNPPSRKASAQPGAVPPGDNAAITLSGDNAAQATWSASHQHSWITITSATGTGSGTLAWSRSTAGLAAGIYVDTIAITATGATGSPSFVIDTLQISSTAVPLVLVVGPASRTVSITQGSTTADDNVAITLSGDNAGFTAWTANKKMPWTTLLNPSGTGSGTLAWHRNSGPLAVGIYVDTITIVAPGAAGSPFSVIDTLTITPAPVPLVLAVTPASRNVSVLQGNPAANGSGTVTLSGDNAATTTWNAVKKKVWTAFTAASGTGSGTVAWARNTSALAAGTYVDTITVSATGASGSPATIIDTVKVMPAPVPLTLALSPTSRTVTVAQGSSAASTNATVTLAGDNAGTAAWTAAKKKSWTTLTTAAGAGSGTVAWSRSTSALAAGTYVDTVTVSATGATGSPAIVIDTIIVTGGSGGIVPDLGINANLHGKQMFPANDPWNTPVDNAALDPNSLAILGNIGLTKSLHPDFGADPPTNQFGYTYIVVPDTLTKSAVSFDYAGESDVGPYPIPANPPIEQGSDGHLFMITQNGWKLYELFALSQQNGLWHAGSGAIYDLATGTQRPAGWTSADAAGLPMIPGMIRYDEVYGTGAINHALRFTVVHTRHAYLFPATHFASGNTNPLLPPMGMRVRLRASFDISGYPAADQVILRALKKYGMIVADNGGDFFVSGVTDSRWDNSVNDLLKQVKVGDFEVVLMQNIITN